MARRNGSAPKNRQVTRECCVTREVKPVEDLIRFALSPDGELVPDVDARAPGRGVWVTLSAAMVDEAVKRKAFARGLKQAVKIPPDLAFQVRSRLEDRLLGALGLARKAGVLVTGATRVRAAIANPGIIALFTATDAAPDGRQKLLGAARAGAEGAEVPHFELLSSDRLGLALGQENVIHAALVAGAAAVSAQARAQRLQRFIAHEAFSGQSDTR